MRKGKEGKLVGNDYFLSTKVIVILRKIILLNLVVGHNVSLVQLEQIATSQRTRPVLTTLRPARFLKNSIPGLI